jgi:chromosome segregation ATPase
MLTCRGFCCAVSWRGSRGEQHALDQSEVLDMTHESEGSASAQVAELQDALRRLQLKVDELQGSNADLHDALAKAEESKEEVEHDLSEALEQRTKYEKLYNDLLEDSIKTSARQSTKVTSEQANLEMSLAEAEAELVAMRAKLAEREGLAVDKRRLLDDLQVHAPP